MGTDCLVSEKPMDPRRHSDRLGLSLFSSSRGRCLPPSLLAQPCSLAGPEECPIQKLCHLPICAVPAGSLHSGNGCYLQPRFQTSKSKNKNNNNNKNRLREVCLLAQGHSLTLATQEGALLPRAPHLLPSTATLWEGCQAVLMPSCQLGPSA